MNRSHIEHALVALFIMLALWGGLSLLDVPSGHWTGAAAGIFFFLGREYTHGERKIAHEENLYLVDLLWYDGLAFWRWSPDGRRDLLYPLITCLLVALLLPPLL